MSKGSFVILFPTFFVEWIYVYIYIYIYVCVRARV